MTRFIQGTWFAIPVIILLAACQIAVAQREEGRRGPGGPDGPRFGGGFGSPILRLSTIPQVQDALKLSQEQKSKIEQLDEDFRDQRRKLLDDGGAGEGMRKLSDDTTARLAELLDDAQQKRLQGIAIQAFGASAVLFDPELAKELNIADEQMDKLKEAQQSNMRSMWEAFREFRDLSADERRAKAEKLREESNKRLLDVLSAEQQEKLSALKGEKVDIDMSDLRGRGRPFDGRGERGRRGRGDRDRDRDNADPEGDTST